MMFYWVRFANGDKGTIEANGIEDAWWVAKDLDGDREILTVNRLPYPAAPSLMGLEYPAFCLQPETCKGKISCPRQPTCVS